MSTELHLTIKADSAAEALAELAEISLRAAAESAVAPQPADIRPSQPELPLDQPAKGNGADETTSTPKRGRRARVAEPDAATQIDRGAIIKGLTEIFMRSEPGIRDRITAFRDGHGVQRLRELKDEALPGAAALLAELQNDSAP